MVADQLGLSPRETAATTMGGNSPQTLVNGTAMEIQRGELDLAILCGGEAWRTRMRARKAGIELQWPTAPAEQMPRLLGEDLEMNHPAERERHIVMPVQVYPMFETAVRAAAGRTVDEQQVLSSELYARFSEVAAANRGTRADPNASGPAAVTGGSPTRGAGRARGRPPPRRSARAPGAPAPAR